MAAIGYTRVQLREEIARVFGLHEDTATGGTTGTLVDGKLSRFADDYWINAQVFVKDDATSTPPPSPTPEGECRFVTDFTSSTGTLTCSPAFSAAPANGDTYQLYRRVPKTDIDIAIQRACAGTPTKKLLTASATTLDYDLSGATDLFGQGQVTGVWVRSLALTDALPYLVQGWQIEENAGLLTLRMPYTLNTSDLLWVTYNTNEAGMAADTSICPLPMRLVKARAVVRLIENKLADQDDSGLQRWGTMLRQWNETLTKEERGYQRPAGKAKVTPWAMDAGNRADQALGLVPGNVP